MSYIDIHTHHTENVENIQIRNIFAQDLLPCEPDYFFSSGLHPWHIGKVNPEDCFKVIEQAIAWKNMLAVGECGLDRSIAADFATQISIFKEQFRIAEKHHKPLIIHCVRAYPDLIKLKKEFKSQIPWILHGYRGNRETTQSLMKHGFYFSVGEQFLKNESNHAVFRNIPFERLFLETDDRAISIQKIYLFAAQILNIDEETLQEALFNNYKTLFGNDKMVAKD